MSKCCPSVTRVFPAAGGGPYTTAPSNDPAIPNGCLFTDTSSGNSVVIDFSKFDFTQLNATQTADFCAAVMACDFTQLPPATCVFFLQCILDNGTQAQFDELCSKFGTILTVSAGPDADPLNATSTADVQCKEVIHFHSSDSSVLVGVTAGSAIVDLRLNPSMLDGGASVEDKTGGDIPGVLVDPVSVSPISGDLVKQVYDNGCVYSFFDGTNWINVPVSAAIGQDYATTDLVSTGARAHTWTHSQTENFDGANHVRDYQLSIIPNAGSHNISEGVSGRDVDVIGSTPGTQVNENLSSTDYDRSFQTGAAQSDLDHSAAAFRVETQELITSDAPRSLLEVQANDSGFNLEYQNDVLTEGTTVGIEGKQNGTDSTELFIRTGDVGRSSAAAGSVLTLVDPATGEVEYQPATALATIDDVCMIDQALSASVFNTANGGTPMDAVDVNAIAGPQFQYTSTVARFIDSLQFVTTGTPGDVITVEVTTPTSSAIESVVIDSGTPFRVFDFTPYRLELAAGEDMLVRVDLPVGSTIQRTTITGGLEETPATTAAANGVTMPRTQLIASSFDRRVLRTLEDGSTFWIDTVANTITVATPAQIALFTECETDLSAKDIAVIQDIINNTELPTEECPISVDPDQNDIGAVPATDGWVSDEFSFYVPDAVSMPYNLTGTVPGGGSFISLQVGTAPGLSDIEDSSAAFVTGINISSAAGAANNTVALPSAGTYYYRLTRTGSNGAASNVQVNIGLMEFTATPCEILTEPELINSLIDDKCAVRVECYNNLIGFDELFNFTTVSAATLPQTLSWTPTVSIPNGRVRIQIEDVPPNEASAFQVQCEIIADGVSAATLTGEALNGQFTGVDFGAFDFVSGVAYDFVVSTTASTITLVASSTTTPVTFDTPPVAGAFPNMSITANGEDEYQVITYSDNSVVAYQDGTEVALDLDNWIECSDDVYASEVIGLEEAIADYECPPIGTTEVYETLTSAYRTAGEPGTLVAPSANIGLNSGVNGVPNDTAVQFHGRLPGDFIDATIRVTRLGAGGGGIQLATSGLLVNTSGGSDYTVEVILANDLEYRWSFHAGSAGGGELFAFSANPVVEYAQGPGGANLTLPFTGNWSNGNNGNPSGMGAAAANSFFVRSNGVSGAASSFSIGLREVPTFPAQPACDRSAAMLAYLNEADANASCIAPAAIADSEAITGLSGTLSNGASYTMTSSGAAPVFSANTDGDIRWEGGSRLSLTFSEPVTLLLRPTTDTTAPINNPLTWSRSNTTALPNYVFNGPFSLATHNGEPIAYTPGAVALNLDVFTDADRPAPTGQDFNLGLGQSAYADDPQSVGTVASDDWGIFSLPAGTEFLVGGRDAEAMNFSVLPYVETDICARLDALESGSGSVTASQVSVTDAGGNFTATNVEDALTELAVDFAPQYREIFGPSGSYAAAPLTAADLHPGGQSTVVVGVQLEQTSIDFPMSIFTAANAGWSVRVLCNSTNGAIVPNIVNEDIEGDEGSGVFNFEDSFVLISGGDSFGWVVTERRVIVPTIQDSWGSASVNTSGSMATASGAGDVPFLTTINGGQTLTLNDNGNNVLVQPSSDPANPQADRIRFEAAGSYRVTWKLDYIVIGGLNQSTYQVRLESNNGTLLNDDGGIIAPGASEERTFTGSMIYTAAVAADSVRFAMGGLTDGATYIPQNIAISVEQVA